MIVPNQPIIVKVLHNPYYQPLMTMFHWWYYTIYFTILWQSSGLYRPDHVCKTLAEQRFAFPLDGIYSYN